MYLRRGLQLNTLLSENPMKKSKYPFCPPLFVDLPKVNVKIAAIEGEYWNVLEYSAVTYSSAGI